MAAFLVLLLFNWDGGTRNQYRASTLNGFPTGNLDRYNATAPWNHKAEGMLAPIPSGLCVVCHSHFCGQDAGLTIYVNPSDMPRPLAAPAT